MRKAKTTLLSALYIAVTAFVIVLLFPRDSKFRYQFYEGKPWLYETLQAPFSFPVYIDSETIEAAKDSIRQQYGASLESRDAMEAKLREIPLTNGTVQKDQKIVDKGEVIDSKIFNVLNSMKIAHDTMSAGAHPASRMFLGQILLVVGLFACFAFYLLTFNPKMFYRRRNLLFLLCCILTACIISELCIRNSSVSIYILPFAILPIVIRTFFDSHTALFTYLITILLCSLNAPDRYDFVLLQTVAGIVVIFSLKELSQRSHLFRCALFMLIAYSVCYMGLFLFHGSDSGKPDWYMFMFFGINFCLTLLSYVLIYMLERLFGYMSPITLVELSNINNPLLKRLSEDAPGTFQHSMQVSILAAEASERIGANTQLLRTGALYHDIGKMNNPAYFTENQQGGFNPHDKLPFEESAKIVIAHVTDGVRMAERAALPNEIINFIKTHHGKGLTKYFYTSFRNAYPDKPVDEKAFTYPGPNPFSKETAILMMADSVEAASRSLKEFTKETIKARIDSIIDAQINDHLLKDAPLTFKDIEEVKEVFLERLLTIYHTRISYPELKK